MEITLSYTGQLANLAGVSEQVLSLDSGSDVGAMVREVVGQHSSDFGEMILDETGKLRRTLLVIADGEQLEGDRESFRLDGVRNITLMTPIAGG